MMTATAAMTDRQAEIERLRALPWLSPSGLLCCSDPRYSLRGPMVEVRIRPDVDPRRPWVTEPEWERGASIGVVCGWRWGHAPAMVPGRLSDGVLSVVAPVGSLVRYTGGMLPRGRQVTEWGIVREDGSVLLLADEAEAETYWHQAVAGVYVR